MWLECPAKDLLGERQRGMHAKTRKRIRNRYLGGEACKRYGLIAICYREYLRVLIRILMIIVCSRLPSLFSPFFFFFRSSSWIFRLSHALRGVYSSISMFFRLSAFSEIVISTALVATPGADIFAFQPLALHCSGTPYPDVPVYWFFFFFLFCCGFWGLPCLLAYSREHNRGCHWV